MLPLSILAVGILAWMNVEDELVTILEGIGEGFYAVDASWTITRFNRVAETHFGVEARSVLGRNLWLVFAGSRETKLGQLFWDTMAQRGSVQSETKSVVVSEDRWLAFRLFPLGDGLGVVFRDVTDRKRAENQRDLLVRELHHRLANTFATIQAIASQTFRYSGVDRHVQETFNERLLNLSRAHTALSNDNWSEVDLHHIISGSLRPYQSGDGARIGISGPVVRLAAQSAIALSMAIHELTTNAVKYGALSSERGRLSITWALDTRFTFVWRESGGPRVTSPKQGGFGSTMLHRVVANQLEGEVVLEFEETGVVCTIDATPSALNPSYLEVGPHSAP